MPTGLQIITDALQDLGVLDATETPESQDVTLGLRRLNQWIGTLALHRQLIFEVRREVFVLAQGVASYTIGPGATWNTVRPVWIDGVSFILDATEADPVEVTRRKPWTTQEFQAIPVKSTTGPIPNGLYCDMAFSASGHATVTVYPVPSTAVARAVLYIPRPLQQFADSTSTYVMPDGFELMLVKGLAVQLQRPYGKTADPGLIEEAREAMDAIKRAYWRPRLMRMPVEALAVGGGAGGRYNIYTDEP